MILLFGAISGARLDVSAYLAVLPAFMVASCVCLVAERQLRPIALGHARAMRMFAYSLLFTGLGMLGDFAARTQAAGAVVSLASSMLYIVGTAMQLLALIRLPLRPLDSHERGLLLIDLTGLGFLTAAATLVLSPMPANLAGWLNIEFVSGICMQTLSAMVMWTLIDLLAREWHMPTRSVYIGLGMAAALTYVGDVALYQGVGPGMSGVLPATALYFVALIVSNLTILRMRDVAQATLAQPILSLREYRKQGVFAEMVTKHWLQLLTVGVLGIIIVIRLQVAMPAGAQQFFLNLCMAVGMVLLTVRQQMIRHTNSWLKARYAKLMNMPQALSAADGIEAIASASLEELRRLVSLDEAFLVLKSEGGAGHAMFHIAPTAGGEGWSVTRKSLTVLPPEFAAVYANNAPSVEVTHTNRSWIGVPLATGDRCIGALSVTRKVADAYTANHAEVLLAFAGQMVGAITARQLRQSEAHNAAITERSRLARELHDSVSQQLFASSLMARSAQQLLATDPVAAAVPLAHTLECTDGALTEMRALIFELRPESLEEEGLLAAFRKQAAALCSRHRIDVHTEFGIAEPELPLRTKEALYRIGMEAVQNTIKHARAVHIVIRLRMEGGRHVLEITDDGVGFDASAKFPGHLGLKTMRERITQFGGDVAISSAPGKGTTVRAIV